MDIDLKNSQIIEELKTHEGHELGVQIVDDHHIDDGLEKIGYCDKEKREPEVFELFLVAELIQLESVQRHEERDD